MASANGAAGTSGLGERERSFSDNGAHPVRAEKEKGKSSNVLQNINRFIAGRAVLQLPHPAARRPGGLPQVPHGGARAEERPRPRVLPRHQRVHQRRPLAAQPPSSLFLVVHPGARRAVPGPTYFPIAEAIQARFFSPESPDSLIPFLADVADCAVHRAVCRCPPSVTLSLFDPLRKALSSVLTSDYHEFKRSPDYDSLSSVLQASGSAHGDERPVDPFDPSSLQLFLLKVKGTKRSKEIKFNKKDMLWTIGRDKSNKLVIEDSRVSRSHARVEYTDSQCEYIDLGSSCGSKLNGKPVHRARLKAGDVIELGQSTLIFQVKPRKRFRLFGGE